MISNRYQIEAQIGEGGMGAVFKGLDTQTGQPIAIKLLKPQILENHPELVERFRREGEALRELNHPNIVKMVDILEDDNKHYIIMEYVSGGDLAGVLAQGNMSVSRILDIAIDLADALTRTHKLGIIHRDLKPANMLIGDDGTLKLTDFSIAHTANNQTHLTESNAIVGTVHYLSPEVLYGEQADNRSDIWAFGIILFEMLTGKKPFTGDTVPSIVQSITRNHIPDLEQLNPECPIGLVDLVYRMLQKDRNHRIRSVRYVGAELEDIVQELAHSRTNEALQLSLSQDTQRFNTPTPEDSSYHLLHNLPAQTTPFVGREHELDELIQLLDSPDARLITILGPGGMGKSRLGMAVGEHQVGKFTDGIYFIELAPLSTIDNISSAIASAINYQFKSDGRTPQEQIVEYLADKNLLLIMDNYEHLLDGAQLMADILTASSDVKIVVTSRQRLQLLGEVLFHLTGMDFPEWETLEDANQYAAVKLFVSSAKRIQLDFELTAHNMNDVAQICQLVEGMPLGIELAASWSDMLSPEEITEELSQSMDFLEKDDNAQNAHRSIRSIMDYSWKQMTDVEQQVFMKLAVFRGGFTRKAAQDVAGANLRILQSLVNKSLIRRNADSGRYVIHALLREFTNHQLKLSQNSSIYPKFSQYYLDFLSKQEKKLQGSEQLDALNRIDVEFENIRRAWQWAVQTRDFDGIGKAIEGISVYLHMRSKWFYDPDIVALFKTTQARLAPTGNEKPHITWAKVLTRGNYYNSVEDYLDNLEKAIEITKMYEDKAEIGLALHMKAIVYPSRTVRIQCREESWPYFEAVGDDYHLASGLAFLSSDYLYLGDYEKALEHNQKALTITQRTGDNDGQIWVYNVFALAAFAKGDIAESKQHTQEILRLARLAKTQWVINQYEQFSAIIYSFGIEGDIAKVHDTYASIKHLFRDPVQTMRFQQAITAAIEENYDDAIDYGKDARLVGYEFHTGINSGWHPINHWGYMMGLAGLQRYDELYKHTRKLLRFFWDLQVRPFLFVGLSFMAILDTYHNDNPQRATKFLALASTHPHSLKGWLTIWPLVDTLKEHLKPEPDEEAYNAAWEQGTQLSLETVIPELLDEFGEAGHDDTQEHPIFNV